MNELNRRLGIRETKAPASQNCIITPPMQIRKAIGKLNFPAIHDQ